MARQTLDDELFGTMFWDSAAGAWGAAVEVPYFEGFGSALRESDRNDRAGANRAAPKREAAAQLSGLLGALQAVTGKTTDEMVEKFSPDMRDAAQRLFGSIQQRAEEVLSPDPLDVDELRSAGQFKLTIPSAKKRPVSDAQRVAWTEFVQRDDLFAEIMSRALGIYRQQRPTRVEWWKRIYGEKNRDLASVVPDVRLVEEFANFVRPLEFRIHPDDGGDVRIGIYFDGSWDRGEGFGVLLGDGKILAIGPKEVALRPASERSKRIDHPVFGPLRWDSTEEAWKGTVRIEPLRAFHDIVEHRLAYRRLKRTDMRGTAPTWDFINGDFELGVVTRRGKEPTPGQADALRAFITDPQRTADQLLAAVRVYYERIFDDYREAFDDEADADAYMPHIDSNDGLRDLMTLDSIRIFLQTEGEPASVGLLFHCSWDEDHGLGVLWRDGQVQEVGQADVAI